MNNVKSSSILSVLIILCLGAYGQAKTDGMIGQRKPCQKVIEINSREAENRTEAMYKLIPHDFAGVCRYGRQIIQPGLERALARMRNTPECKYQKDFYIKAIYEKTLKAAEFNKKAMERDCKKAGM